jgi:Flp pilus assembly protein TadD
VATFYDWDARGADAAFQEAIRLNANDAEAHSAYAQMLTSLEPRFSEALDHARRSLALNPIDPWAHWYVGFAQYFGRDYEGRIETHRRLLQLHPNWGMAHFGLGIALSTVGRPIEATACHLRAIELDGRGPNHVAFLGVSYALSGNATAAHACLAELEAQEANRQSVWGWKLMLHAVFNNVDDVIGALDRAVEERSSSLIMQLNHPFLDCVRGDERYHAILRRMGLASLVGWRPQRGWSPS